jgi:hypothetical protein
MKLLIGGKSRNIYMRKDGSAYYKSGGEKVDASYMFKKNGDLKKQYSENVKETHRIKKNKKFYGGNTINITFQDINFNSDTNTTNDNKRKELLKLLQIAYNVVLEQSIRVDKTNNDMVDDDDKKQFLINVLFALKYALLIKDNDKTIEEYKQKSNNTNVYYLEIKKIFTTTDVKYVQIIHELSALTYNVLSLKPNDPKITTMFDNIKSIIRSLRTKGNASVDASVGFPQEAATAAAPTATAAAPAAPPHRRRDKSPAAPPAPAPPPAAPAAAPAAPPRRRRDKSPAAPPAPAPPPVEASEIDAVQKLLDDLKELIKPLVGTNKSEGSNTGGNVPPVVQPPVVQPPVVPPRLIHTIQQQLINTQTAINKIIKVIKKIKQIKDKIKDWSTTKSSEEIRQNKKKLIEVEKQIQEKVIIVKQTVDNIIKFVLTIQKQTKFEIQINEANKLLSILEKLKTLEELN